MMVGSLEYRINELLQIPDRNEFLRQRALLTADFGQQEWCTFLRVWIESEKERYPIVELVGEELASPVGKGVYTALETNKGRPQELLRKAIDNYGIFDDRKAKVFIEKKEKGERQILCKAFFEGEHVVRNAKFLINYAWENVWKTEYEIPELVGDGLAGTVGIGVYSALDVDLGRPQELLRKAIDNYGVFDDDKAKVFIEKKKKGERYTLSKAFFDENHAVSNAKFLINYAWKNVWKTEYEIPELVGDGLVGTVGVRVYSILDVDSGNPQELLRKAIDNYGIFDDTRAKVFIEKKEKGERQMLSRAFFEGEHSQQNARFLLEYAWKNVWKTEYEIPELVGAELKDVVGSGVYIALGTNEGRPQELLRKGIDNYGIFDDEKAKVFIEKKKKGERYTLSRAFFEGEHVVRNAKFLINYAWENVWKTEYEIPELVGDGLAGTVGIGLYSALDVDFGKPQELLRKTIDNYGIFDDTKAELFIGTKHSGKRQMLCRAFFDENHAVSNAKFLINYAWENIWKTEYEIPELLGLKINDKVGNGIYSALGVPFGNIEGLLRKTIDDYGIFDDEKAKVFIEKKEKGERYTLCKAFFDENHAVSNAKFLINYAWENIWKTEYEIPELVGAELKDVVGGGVYTALAIKMGHSQGLLGEVIDNYGKLDENKAKIYVQKREQLPVQKRRITDSIFFTGTHAQPNIEIYLETYQRIHQKRMRDFRDEDYTTLPKVVEEYAKRRKQQQPKQRGYNQIQIRWNDQLHARLELLWTQYGAKLFGNPNLLWRELGITPFAAQMKAAELGFIPEITFGTEPTERMPIYRFVEYTRYQSIEEMTQQAREFEERTSINVEGFTSPFHRQGVHVQVPIFYRGVDMQKYSEKEQEIIRILATYMEYPGLFIETTAHDRLRGLAPPTTLVDPHTLVPLKTEPMLTKLYLPRVNAADPGGVQSAVLKASETDIFFFYHNAVGQVTGCE